MNYFNIEKQFALMKERNWDKLYWAIDLHDTVLYADYTNSKPIKFAPGAKEVLKRLSKSPSSYLIMFTCSYPEEIKKYLEFFKEHDITFDSVYENPDVSNSKYGYFDKKPYYNILLEDKAGFDKEDDWTEIDLILDKYPHLL